MLNVMCNHVSDQTASNINNAETPDSRPPNKTISINEITVPIVITTMPTMKAMNNFMIDSFMSS